MVQNRFKLLLQDPLYERSQPYLITREGVLANGKGNLGPDIIEDLVYRSPVATQCVTTYRNYLVGSNFEVEDINLALYGWEPYTIQDLLVDVCKSVSKHGGAFIHVTYDGNLLARSFRVLPYQNCRVSLADDTGFVRNIVYRKFGWNPNISYTYKKQNRREVYYAYNPIESVLREQVDSAGGIQDYNGQIYYLKLDNDYPYTTGLIDSVKDLVEADAQVNLYYKNRIVGGFQNTKILRHDTTLSGKELEDLEEQLRSTLGARNANSILRIADNLTTTKPDGSFRIENIGDNVKADIYSYIDTQISDKIRRAFLNIPHQLIQATAGRLGSSAELKEAVSIYNSFTADHRNLIQRKLQQLFDNFVEPIELGDIGVYRLLDDGSIQDNPTPEAPQNNPEA